jgi:hypothetical protein
MDALVFWFVYAAVGLKGVEGFSRVEVWLLSILF